MQRQLAKTLALSVLVESFSATELTLQEHWLASTIMLTIARNVLMVIAALTSQERSLVTSVLMTGLPWVKLLVFLAARQGSTRRPIAKIAKQVNTRLPLPQRHAKNATQVTMLKIKLRLHARAVRLGSTKNLQRRRQLATSAWPGNTALHLQLPRATTACLVRLGNIPVDLPK